MSEINVSVTTANGVTEITFKDKGGLFCGLLSEREPGKITVFGVGIGSPVRFTTVLAHAMLPYIRAFAAMGKLLLADGELLPCPFCKDEAEFTGPLLNSKSTRGQPGCRECEIWMPTADKWNGIVKQEAKV